MMIRKKIIAVLALTSILGALEIYPQNIFLDRYELIPPLGKIKSIATSIDKVFAVSDNYLLIFDKKSLELLRTTYFKKEISLVGYDPFADELWISGVYSIIRYNFHLGTVREYGFPGVINGIGFDQQRVYISSQKKYAMDRINGNLEVVPQFPENVIWYKNFEKKQLNEYIFLTPYFYQDSLMQTNNPFHRYEITALYDEGQELYVGTDQYGILRYNKITMFRERIIYGPLVTRGVKLKKIATDYFFISSAGISLLKSEDIKNWYYFRLSGDPSDFLYINGDYIVSFGNQIASIRGAMTTPIAYFKNKIITINFDGMNIYVGTNNGMFKILRDTNEPLDFGPNRYPVYVIYPMDDQILVGGEHATYQYDRQQNRWFQIMPWGTRDICKLKSSLYFLTHENQLIKYPLFADSSAKEGDTVPSILPYFNIYDVDTDGEVLYCATGSGINYFEPLSANYNPIYNLPRIKYNHVAVVDEYIIAVSDENIYRLARKYRD